jgi:hypothetical protein
MDFDSDIKIAGSKPSGDIKNNKVTENASEEIVSHTDSLRAKKLGERVAGKFCADNNDFSIANDEFDSQMALQRRILLSFTTSVALEQFCKSEAVAGIAQKSFIDSVSKLSGAFYDTSSDTGAFSFYFLAFRRGGDVERRIGQTFAMLCSHDGDPIYQELGEALYCWFSSTVENLVEEFDLKK